MGQVLLLRCPDGVVGEEEESILENILDIMACGEVEIKLSRKIGKFVEACSIRERRNFMSSRTNRYRFELIVDPTIIKEKNLIKPKN